MMRTGNFKGFEVAIHDPGIVVITFNQPERLNGTTQGMKRDLVETLIQVQMDDGVRVVVFTGSGRAFCAGDDLKGGDPEGDSLTEPIFHGHHTPMGTYDGLRALSQPLNTSIRNLDKLTIAGINGVAIQTGLSLALSCDLRIASTEARLGSATLRFGLLPDEGGQALLIQTIGLPKTMDFLMRKKIVGATEAAEMDMVHEVVEPERLMPRTMELAKELAEGPQVAMRMLKRSIYNAIDLSFEQALDEIASKTAVTDHHPDAREGIVAFQKKTNPEFNKDMPAREATV